MKKTSPTPSATKMKPRKNQIVTNVETGEVLGIVESCNDKVCYLTNGKMFIWQFIDGSNNMFDWQYEPIADRMEEAGPAWAGTSDHAQSFQ